jgi:hypothetical protein
LGIDGTSRAKYEESSDVANEKMMRMFSHSFHDHRHDNVDASIAINFRIPRHADLHIQKKSFFVIQ